MLVRKKPAIGFTKNRSPIFIKLGSRAGDGGPDFSNYCRLLVNLFPFQDGVCSQRKTKMWNSTLLLRETNV
jgi:hypothetical protein